MKIKYTVLNNFILFAARGSGTSGCHPLHLVYSANPALFPEMILSVYIQGAAASLTWPEHAFVPTAPFLERMLDVFTAWLIFQVLTLSAWCWDSACQVLSPHHKWISQNAHVWLQVHVCRSSLACRRARTRCSTYLCFWECVGTLCTCERCLRVILSALWRCHCGA